jgi:3-oxoacyl-[acyl-carrier-protein] synthase II
MQRLTKKRVVVTGLGVISPIGVGKNELWLSLMNSKTNFTEVDDFDTSLYRTKKAALIKNSILDNYIDSKRLRKLDKCSKYAVIASRLAVEDSGIDKNDLSDAGCIIATTSGGWVSGEKYYEDYLGNKNNKKSLRLIFDSPYFRPTFYVSRELGLKGASSTISAACASGNMGIAHAMDLIRYGEYDIMLAGGSDAIAQVPFSLFNALRVVSDSVCNPFDKNRSGLILAEGSAILVLESLEHALGRGATIYAEIKGYGLSCDANHMTRSQPDGLAVAISNAFIDANIKSQDVSYINAHGTGTKANDLNEVKALKLAFPDNSKEVPLSSTKASTGHLQGTSGSIEAVISALSIKNGVIPHTVNLEEPDHDMDFDFVINSPRQTNVNVVLSNSMGFGGVNASIILSKLDKYDKKCEEDLQDKDIPNRRIVISGLSAITPLGVGKEILWSVLEKGVTCHGKIDDLKVHSFEDDSKIKLDRISSFVLNASRQALIDANIELSDTNKDNIGVSLETFYGSQCITEVLLNTIIKHGPRKIDPIDVPKNTFNAPSTFTSMALGLKGPNATFANAYGAGLNSMTYALNLLQLGKSEIMLCGGYDEFSDLFIDVNPVYQEFPYTTRKRQKSTGLHISEGIGIVVLETLDSAIKRGAHIYAEILGCSSKGYSNIKTDLRETIKFTIEDAIEKSGIKANDINCVYTNNTFIDSVDSSEKSVLNSIFENVNTVDLKKYLGHTLGASSYLELIGAALSIEKNTVPSISNTSQNKTVNLQGNNDFNSDLNYVLLNTLELGGNISSIIIKRL